MRQAEPPPTRNEDFVDRDDAALFRREPRADASFPVTIILPGDELVVEGSAIDVSASGIRIGLGIDLPSGRDVILRFSLPDDLTERMVRGRVVLAFYDATLMLFVHGIVFTQFADTDKAAITAFVGN